MKKSFIFIFILLLTLIMGCNPLKQEKMLYLGHVLPESHPVHEAIVFMQKRLSEISGGKMNIKIFANSTLGSERELLELLQVGSLSMTKVSAAVMANFVPEYKVLGLPYIFRDSEHKFRVLEGEIGKSMLEKGGDYWLRGLCFYDAGSRSFYTVEKPIRKPDDLKGLKIRVMNHQQSIDLVNAMGGSATPIAWGELYSALQQGIVDGAENNPPTFVASRHFELCKYYNIDEHSAVPDLLVIGTKTWDRLTDQEKKWVQQAADESLAEQKKLWASSVAACLKMVQEAGVEVIYPEKSPFAEIVKPVITAFAKEPGMAAIVKAIQETK